MRTKYWSLHLSIVGASSRTVAYKKQRCKATKYTLLCFQSKIFLNLCYGSMEWNIEENFSTEWNMEWKILGMEWKWIGRKLPVWNMEKSSSIPMHTMPCLTIYFNWVSMRLTLKL